MRREYFMGEACLPRVRLTVGERSALASASVILARLRELRDDADDELTTDVALASHVCRELSEEGLVLQ